MVCKTGRLLAESQFNKGTVLWKNHQVKTRRTPLVHQYSHDFLHTHTHTYIYMHTTGPVIPKGEKNVCKVYMIKFYQVIWQGSMSRSFLFRPAKLCNEA